MEKEKWTSSPERTAQLLQGTIDLHIHSGPAAFPRPYNDIEIAQMAKNAGMRAVVVKDHHMSTTARAYYARTTVPGVEVFGSVCLNEYEGGLNPYIIDSELRYGLKVVWLPTVSAVNHIKKFGGPSFPTRDIKFRIPAKGISLLDGDNLLKKELYPILELIAENDLILATGHISVDEVEKLVPEARRVGVKKIIITHINAPLIQPSLELQKTWAEQGNFLEYTYLPCTAMWYTISPREILRWIGEIGSDHIVLSTDLANYYTCSPAEGMRIFMEIFLTLGLPHREIETMVKHNPAKLLGI